MTTPLPNCGGVVPDLRALHDLAEFFLPALQGPAWKGKRYETAEQIVDTALYVWARLTPQHGSTGATGGLMLVYLDYGSGSDGPHIRVTLDTHDDVSLYVAPERRSEGKIALAPQPVAQGEEAVHG